MVKRTVNYVRWTVRVSGATIIWLNALAIFTPSLHPFLQKLATILGIEHTSVPLFLLLFTLSLASAYGITNFIIECIFIYCFPVFLIWAMAKGAVHVLRWLHRVVRSLMPSPEEPMSYKEVKPMLDSIRKNVKPKRDPPTQAEVSSGDNTEPLSPRLRGLKESIFNGRGVRTVSIVLIRSMLFCGLLVTVSSVRGLITTCCVWLIAGLIATNLWAFRGATIIKAFNIQLQAEGSQWIAFLCNWCSVNFKGSFLSNDKTAAPKYLKFFVNIMSKTKETTEILVLAGVLASGVMYVWLSFVFYFIYIGIAKLSLPGPEWPSLIDSLLFPIFASNIARTWILKTAVTIQWLEITLIGYLIWSLVASELKRFRKALMTYESFLDNEIQLLDSVIESQADSDKRTVITNADTIRDIPSQMTDMGA